MLQPQTPQHFERLVQPLVDVLQSSVPCFVAVRHMISKGPLLLHPCSAYSRLFKLHLIHALLFTCSLSRRLFRRMMSSGPTLRRLYLPGLDFLKVTRRCCLLLSLQQKAH
jgi:hypothetical protein